MTPAAACEGFIKNSNCNFKVRTKHEPATEKEMNDLLWEINAHSGTQGAQLIALDVAKSFPDAHLTSYKYYEKTPEKGFENAKVV